MIFMWIAYGTLFISIVSFIFGCYRNQHFHWLAACAMYIFSFLGGFSIGQLTVGLTFIPLTLAIGHLFHLNHTTKQRIILIVSGVVIGIVVVLFVRSVIFYPLLWLLSPFLS